MTRTKFSARHNFHTYAAHITYDEGRGWRIGSSLYRELTLGLDFFYSGCCIVGR